MSFYLSNESANFINTQKIPERRKNRVFEEVLKWLRARYI